MFKHLSPDIISARSACVMKNFAPTLGSPNCVASHDTSTGFLYTQNNVFINSPNGSASAATSASPRRLSGKCTL